MDIERPAVGDSFSLRAVAVALLMAAGVFAVIAPTLPALPFNDGGENLVVATALEIRRNGNGQAWLEPTLQGEPRTRKPPLAAWIAAASIRADTLAELSAVDKAVRDRAYRQLAWQVRWPALVCACLSLAATWALARILAGASAGWLAVFICAGNYFFLRFGIGATVDTQLLLWVTLANAGLAAALFQNRWWLGCAIAGLCAGLGVMSKGPVALLQTIAPILAMAAMRRYRPAQIDSPPGSVRWGPALAGLALLLAIALPWFSYIIAHVPNVLAQWKTEVLRSGATDMKAGAIYSYLVFIPFFLPWTIFLLSAYKPALQSRRLLAAALWLLVPILVMLFFRDRKERYLLPMIAPASVLAAAGILQLRQIRRPTLFVGLLVAVVLIGYSAGMVVYGSSEAATNNSQKLADSILAKYGDPDVYYYRTDSKVKLAPNDLAIYLNRAVRRVGEIPQSRSGRPVVLIVVEQKGQGAPQIAGWKSIDAVGRDEDKLHAFVAGEP